MKQDKRPWANREEKPEKTERAKTFSTMTPPEEKETRSFFQPFENEIF